MSAICRKSWPNMLAISTTGARIDRWGNGRPAHREQARLIEALKLERSSRYLCSDAFITFISKPHDHVSDPILAPYNGLERPRRRLPTHQSPPLFEGTLRTFGRLNPSRKTNGNSRKFLINCLLFSLPEGVAEKGLHPQVRIHARMHP